MGFTAPWMLLALATLPALWWLLRATPPAPRTVAFPALRLLRDLIQREETPQRTPWWLLLLRMTIAAAAIVALSGPILNPTPPAPGSGPLLLVVDNGWASARNWEQMRQAMDGAIDGAASAGRPLLLLPTAPNADGTPPRLSGVLRAADAHAQADALRPQPWPVDRAGAAKAIAAAPQAATAGGALWLSDGIETAGAEALSARLAPLRPLVRVPDGSVLPDLLLPPSPGDPNLATRLHRAEAGGEAERQVRALGSDGRILARIPARFAGGARDAQIAFDLPLERRNAIARLEIENQPTIGGTVLLDEMWRRRPVGIVRYGGDEQRLLSDAYYLDRALAPFAEVRTGDVATLLQRETAVLILPDGGALAEEDARVLRAWVEKGGLLLRFAGPLLAQGGDSLLPVRLRVGDRALGGTLSWDKPMSLAPFPEASPLAGLAIPPDVTVRRQVLAEPTIDLAEKSWARLADGTPLVTAERRGQGRIVLVHTSAGPEWSNLALSGLYVDLLRRIVQVSAGLSGQTGTQPLEPKRLLDAFAQLTDPTATALPIAADQIQATDVGPTHPPGYYGPEEQRRSLNLTQRLTSLAPLSSLPSGATRAGYQQEGETRLAGWLLAAALLLFAIDTVAALWLGGLLRARRPRAATATLALAALLLTAGSAGAQTRSAAELAGKTTLGWVVTGDAQADRTSRAGLTALARALMQRTAIDEAAATAVDLEQDELAFFPVLYWPSTPSQPELSERARGKVNQFLQHGGMLLIDTRDGGSTPSPAMKRALQGLAIPPLGRAAADHVLGKSFYLLNGQPGRYDSRGIWVDSSAEEKNDRVSPVVLGGNDWAAAWAEDEHGRPLFAVAPGGERQREQAFRFGINLVMYALTGNYKADQVHVPFILQRLGQ